MSNYLRAGFALAFAAVLAIPAHAGAAKTRNTLPAFASEEQLRAFLARQPVPSSAPPSVWTGEDNELLQKVEVTGSSIQAIPAAESVTNNQSAGVDEGGIVKVHGNHLVMLRRGRLFTVDIGHGQLKPVSAINAYAPDLEPSGSWYDEMLISGDTVAVIGYSYARGGTEIGLFDIDAAGHLGYRATYHLRSNDYYSSRNYASRQIGSKLIFYTPLNLHLGRNDPYASFPALRKWRANSTPEDFKRIVPATRIYHLDDPIEPGTRSALHTVTVCDLARRDMTCQSSAVLAPRGRVFYVSSRAVYVWTTAVEQAANGSKRQAGLFRMPLDGSAPSALKVNGAPVDQFSFLESGDGYLNVLVRAEGAGEGMWLAGQGRGPLALLRVPLATFSDGRDSAAPQSYRGLPGTGARGVENRFVGAHLLYGNSDEGVDEGSARPEQLFAVRWDGKGQAQTLPLPHAVERIESMGMDAVVIGSRAKDLHFTSVSLGTQAAVEHNYIRRNEAQSESRSHGFFYKPGPAGLGIVGLPVVGATNGAAVLYLRNAHSALSALGALEAQQAKQTDDNCRASCVDWYGNARPLFLQGRIFALMGYELVEGKADGKRVVESRRINYAPDSVDKTAR